jgi:ElaA protein
VTSRVTEPGGGSAAVRVAAFADLDARTAYLLCALRVEVFVVEQECAYRELDGRDLEPQTRHVWAEVDGAPIAYLRLLTEPDGVLRIGRVCVAASARGQGWAGALMDRALQEVGERPCVLDAQAHLADWYARWGFAVTGPEFLDDGIPHVPMARR